MTRYWEKLLHYTYTGLLSWEVSNYLVSRLKKKKKWNQHSDVKMPLVTRQVSPERVLRAWWMGICKQLQQNTPLLWSKPHNTSLFHH